MWLNDHVADGPLVLLGQLRVRNESNAIEVPQNLHLNVLVEALVGMERSVTTIQKTSIDVEARQDQCFDVLVHTIQKRIKLVTERAVIVSAVDVLVESRI